MYASSDVRIQLYVLGALKRHMVLFNLSLTQDIVALRGQVVSTWADAIFILLELLPKHPAIPSLHTLSRSHHGLGLREIEDEVRVCTCLCACVQDAE